MTDQELIASSESRRKDALQKRITQTFPFYRYGSRQGIIAGLLMGLYLLLLQATVADPSAGLKFFKYLLLAGVLGISIFQYRKKLPRGRIFRNGILLGLFITFVSALSLIALNGLVWLLNADWAIEKFSVEPTTLGALLVVDGVVFFEILVYGMILTFIWLQYFKSKVSA